MQEGIDYFDISPILSVKTAVFPGDTPLTQNVVLDFETGDKNLLLSTLTTSVHIGAHADAPNHYSSQGEGIGERDLSCYMGLCQVINVNLVQGARITIADLQKTEIKAPRVLFRTLTFPDPNHWNSDFSSLSAELIDFLSTQRVRLVGIDTPSIDPETSKALEAHNAVLRNGMAILEGLVLTAVNDGLYSLVALPLRLVGFDASPVRAVLFKNTAMFAI